MPSTMRLSPPSRDVRRSGPWHVLAGSVGLLLFETGCPQLLEDRFSEHGSKLELADASAGGACGGALCAGGGAGGSSGPDRGGAAGNAASGGAGGSGGGAPGGRGGSGGSGAGSAGAGGTPTTAELRNCPFGAPEPLAGLDFASGSEWGASLTADGLTLYFAQGPSNDADLYRATRSDRGVTFSAPVALTNINTNDDEGTPFISADGLRLYYYSTRVGGPGSKDLYVATRADVAEEFPSGQLLANVNSPELDHLPRLSPDELTLWFTSTREGSAEADLWTASRSSVSVSFGTPTLLGAINGSAGDESGGFTQDRLMLFFDSTRAGVGNSEIFFTSRTGADQAFAAPTSLSAVNSEWNEYNVFLTSDERELFFSSNRTAHSTHHLFRALRHCD